MLSERKTTYKIKTNFQLHFNLMTDYRKLYIHLRCTFCYCNICPLPFPCISLHPQLNHFILVVISHYSKYIYKYVCVYVYVCIHFIFIYLIYIFKNIYIICIFIIYIFIYLNIYIFIIDIYCIFLYIVLYTYIKI